MLKTKSILRKSLRWSHIEGGLYSVMVGSAEIFATYFAIRRGVSAQELGILTTVPLMLGALANWILPLFTPHRWLKSGVLICVSVQILGLAGLITAASSNHSFILLFISLCLYWMGGMASGPLWLDWMSPWLPKERIGRFLSRRYAYVALITVITYLFFALIIHKFFSGLEIFKFVFGFALLARSLSLVMLMLQQNPHRTHSIHSSETASTAHRVLKAKPVILTIIFASLFRLVANIASPYFASYMVDDLKLSTLHYAIITAAPYLGRFIFTARWGEVNRLHRPFIGLQVSMFFVFLACVLWYQFVGLSSLSLTEAISGAAWGGFELALILIIHAFSPGSSRSLLGFAIAATYLAAILGALIGSHLLENNWTHLEVIRCSAIGRLVIFIAFLLSCRLWSDTRVRIIDYKKYMIKLFSFKGFGTGSSTNIS